MIRVAIAGHFDPPHEGHLDHIRKASKLGDLLIVMVNPDSDCIRKKGYCLLPQDLRMELVDGLLSLHNIRGYSVPVVDSDGTVAQTLKLHKPTFFAKGGDRVRNNMPKQELDACEEIRCRVEYGMGELLGSSSKYFEAAVKQYLEAKNK